MTVASLRMLVALAVAFGASTMFLLLQVLIYVMSKVINPDIATICTFVSLWTGHQVVLFFKRLKKK